jgi:hypothetical protein
VVCTVCAAEIPKENHLASKHLDYGMPPRNFEIAQWDLSVLAPDGHIASGKSKHLSSIGSGHTLDGSPQSGWKTQVLIDDVCTLVGAIRRTLKLDQLLIQHPCDFCRR